MSDNLPKQVEQGPTVLNVPDNIVGVNPYSVPMGIPMFPLYGYDNSQDLDKDYQYMQKLYPKTAKSIYSEVVKECYKLDYDGSFIFDEYPDKTSLNRVVDRIALNIQNVEAEAMTKVKSLSYYPRQNRNNLRDIISIILLNEIFNRRRRYRSRRRWY